MTIQFFLHLSCKGKKSERAAHTHRGRDREEDGERGGKLVN